MPNLPPTHRKPASRTAQQYERERGSSHARGYGEAWRKLRAAVLADEPLCRACGAGPPPGRDMHVDHIVPRARGGTDDRANLQTLCPSCHSAKTAREDGGGWRR